MKQLLKNLCCVWVKPFTDKSLGFKRVAKRIIGYDYPIHGYYIVEKGS